uniref:Uncharacterized protein n=1 Tax=Oryza punctata TaxID=4537 RepID=A0A0E0JD45_ORYPU
MEISGECEYRSEAVVVTPSEATPRRSLYLSNLDDQRFLRFSIKYLYVFPPSAAIAPDALRAALARALVRYYPLAGRLRHSDADADKLVLDCNAQGALFAEAFLPTLTAADFLRPSAKPHKSWRKLLYRLDAATFVAVPPLVVQVTQLGCGGMVLCTAISHCVCDGIATANFLHAWAAFAAGHQHHHLAILHDRRALRPRCPPRVAFAHPEYTSSTDPCSLLSQPLAPVSLTFTSAHLRRLKTRCSPSLRCTSFEALAAHVWRAWVLSLGAPPDMRVKLLFSVNVRRRLKPELPWTYCGNAFVLGCAEATASELVAGGGVRLVQEAKECIDDDYVRSTVDLLEERRGAKPDLAATLVISAWTRLGLEDVDFGKGRAAHMGPLTSEIYCVFLPVLADPDAVTVLVSVPQPAADTFEHHCCSCFLLDDEPAIMHAATPTAIAAGVVDKEHDKQLVVGHHQHDILA